MFKAIKNKWLGMCLTLCLLLSAAFGCLMSNETKVSAEASGKTAVKIEGTEYLDGTVLIFYLNNADYMTASDWSVGNYKWTDAITQANKTQYNVHNAMLDKNASDYNYGDAITVDGTPLKGLSVAVQANKYQRVNGLGLTFPAGVLKEGTVITFAAGCQLPTLAHAYLGETEFTYLEIEEETSFLIRNGVLSKKYNFNGYEEGVTYDADEQMVYLRADGSSYKGHAEAATCYRTDELIPHRGNGLSVKSTANTDKGNLFVLEFVNPIDTTQFAKLNLRFFSNIPRKVVTYNAYAITEESLGEPLEHFSIARVFSTQSLLSALYANDEGMIDTLVFQFEDDKSGNLGNDPLFFEEFELASCDLVYDESVSIAENETDYTLSLRLNKVGEVGDAVLDTQNVVVNGATLAEIVAAGGCKQAALVNFGKLYQIDVVMDKTYEGVGAVKNAQYGFAGNSIGLKKGFTFPDGSVLGQNYVCHIYKGEVFVDSPADLDYKPLSVTRMEIGLAADAKDNIRIHIYFNRPICPQTYYHACETEAWRASALDAAGLYDKQITDAYIKGGYKSSLLDNVYINGYSVGEWHAIDDCSTSVHIHMGAADGSSANLMTVAIDSTSQMYATLLPIYQSGTGLTVEVREGYFTPTGCKTNETQVFVLTGKQMTETNVGGTMSVYYDGKAVADGDLIDSMTAASKTNIEVDGVLSYTLEETQQGDVVEYKVVSADGKTLTFYVKAVIVNEIPEGKSGCGSSMGAIGTLCALLVLCGATLVKGGRKDA